VASLTKASTVCGFPSGFLWGAATSAFQIEGSPLADGAGPSIWYRFTHDPTWPRGADNGDVACDHYNLWADDVALMREIGIAAYRFSIAWGRILPQGRGRVNPRGLDFYSRLIDALLESSIQPFVTLYHWDLPAALDELGGWLNDDVAGWFADYAAVVVRALSDRVRFFVTLNEPWVVADGGYVHGVLAPGHRSLPEAPLAARNLLRAHVSGAQACRAAGARAVGLVVNLEPQHPASSNAEDVAAARRADAYINRQYLDTVFFGTYPGELPEMFGNAWPAFPVADLHALRQPPDFLGVNYYSRGVVRHDPEALPACASKVRQSESRYTEMDWEIHAPGLEEILTWVRSRYGDVPLYITENGAAFDDPQPVGGRVEDGPRVAYLSEHLLAARRALAAGVNLRGFFVWSLLDNFEWSHGTSKRFGIVYVDFSNQRRTPKASASFYADVIRTNGANLGAGGR
jgi:beta-glucosidase